MTQRRKLPLIILSLVLMRPVGAGADDRTDAAREEFRQGKADFLEGRYEDAVRHFEQAMSIKPSAKLHYNVGLAYEKLDQTARALESFHAYLKAEPRAENADEVRQRIAKLEAQPSGPPPAPVLVTPRTPPPPVQPRPAVVPELPAQTPPAASTVVVDFSSNPRGADLFVDGRPLGLTPIALAMVAGASYEVQMRKRGYASQTISMVARPASPVYVPLVRTSEGRLRAMTRTEWFALEPVIGAQSGEFAIGLRVAAFGLRWHYFYWNIIEAGGHVGIYGGADVGTRVGFPLYWGAAGQHQLRVGLGMGGGVVSKLTGIDSHSQSGLILSPSLEYRYQGSRRFFVGAGIRYAGMVAGHVESDYRPHAVLLSVPMGWSALE